MGSVNTYNRLKAFQNEHNAVTKEPLSLMIQLTRTIKYKRLPIAPDDFLTENKGQVAGLGGGNLIKYSRLYSGCEPELIEGDIFKSIIPLVDTSEKQANKTSEKQANKTSEKLSEGGSLWIYH